MDLVVAVLLLVLFAVAGTLALGLPIWSTFAPFIASFGIVFYYESGHFRDYSIFVVGGMCTGAYFMYHFFWYLDEVWVIK